MTIKDLQKLKLSNTPGVYFFIGPKRRILYIGKATSLKDRVRSYFSRDLAKTRGVHIFKMIQGAKMVKTEQTNSVLEALVLESALIKKYKPRYNTDEKDDKSFNHIVITDEDFPRVLIVRGRDLSDKLSAKSYKLKAVYGPFPRGGELREAMKLVRKIFPFRDKCIPFIQGETLDKTEACFSQQIGLCPGVCSGEISKEDYRMQIRNLKLFLGGKSKLLVKNLQRDMKIVAKEHEFERAGEIKKQLFALTHIQDVAIMKREMARGVVGETFRIEAYDVAHLSGKNSVAVMTVIENGEVNKDEYRKFKLRGLDPVRSRSPQGDRSTRLVARAASNGTGADDLASLEEVLRRRFNHLEWRMPNIVVVDGGANQKRRAEKVLKEMGISMSIVAVVKNEFHKPRAILGEAKIARQYEREILLANSEAHRFATRYHREIRDKIK